MKSGDAATLKALAALTAAAFIVWTCQLGSLSRRKQGVIGSPPSSSSSSSALIGEVEDGSWGAGSSPDERLKLILEMDEKRERDLNRLGMRPQTTSNGKPLEPDRTQPKPDTNPNQKIPLNEDANPLRRLGVNLPKYKPIPETNMPERAKSVVTALKHAWKCYTESAWGHDEAKPFTSTYHDWVENGLGLTLIDSLDTLYITGLHDEFSDAVQWVKTPQNLNVTSKNGFISIFETTIRVVGGLLSAYTLSHDKGLMDKAIQILDALMPAFNKTKTGIPYSLYNPVEGKVKNYPWTRDHAILSEVGTLQLEFRFASWLTGDPRYDLAATTAFDSLTNPLRRGYKDGLYPLFVSPSSGNFASSLYGLGGMGDSHYEYLLKQWIFSSKKKSFDKYRSMWDTSLSGIRKWLVGRSGKRYFTGQLFNSELRHKMDHLSCFFPGLIALDLLSSVTNEGARGKRSGGWGEKIGLKKLAVELMETCIEMHNTITGLAPEESLVMDGKVIPVTKFYLLRPETVESLFYLHRLTNDERYRDVGWKIFTAVERHCKHPSAGYHGLESVTSPHSPPKNSMESFFTAETLKYLYLLFSNDTVLPLDKYVLNTEAHVFPIIPKPGASLSGD